MTDAEECEYFTGVLKHLGDLIQRTPKDQPLFKLAADASDAISPPVGYFIPDRELAKEPAT